MLKILLSVFLSLQGSIAFAAADKGIPPIEAGSVITVNDYQKDLDVFLITRNKYPGIGPNYVKPADLFKALQHEGNVKDFVKRHARLKGSVFTIKKDLPLVPQAELLKKYKKVKKK